MEYGLPADVVRCARKSISDPFWGSLFVADPRFSLPVPSDSSVIKWWLRIFGVEALFSGPCFADGSVEAGGHPWSARAGWAVIELDKVDGYLVFCNSSVCGTLPGRVQTISGAELYAVLMRLRHLSPWYDGHVLHSDSAWVVGGWNGEYDVLGPWTPFREIWLAIATLRLEWPRPVVMKVKAHLTAKAVEHSSVLQWARRGNAIADALAKEAAALHPSSPLITTRLERCTRLIKILAPYYARLIAWVLDRDIQPAKVSYAKRCRYYELPVHIFAAGPGGKVRCVRCFRLAIDLASLGLPCRLAGPGRTARFSSAKASSARGVELTRSAALSSSALPAQAGRPVSRRANDLDGCLLAYTRYMVRICFRAMVLETNYFLYSFET